MSGHHEFQVQFRTVLTDEARNLLFGSPEWWRHLRAAVSEGICPGCTARMEPLPDHEARIAGYCPSCNRTFWTGGPDTEYAEAGEAVGRQ